MADFASTATPVLELTFPDYFTTACTTTSTGVANDVSFQGLYTLQGGQRDSPH